MTPQNIIKRLEAQTNFFDFCQELNSIYQRHPISMTVSEDILTAVRSSPWLQSAEDIFLKLQYYRDGQYVINRSVAAKLFSYIGNIINDEEFWFEVLRVQPTFARYWFKPTDSFRSAIALLK